MVVFSCIPWTSWIVAHLLYQKAGGLLDSAGPGRIHSLHLPMSFPKCFKTTDFTFQRPCLQRCPCSDGTSHRETSEHHALWRDAPLLTSKLVKLYNVILCYTAYIYTCFWTGFPILFIVFVGTTCESLEDAEPISNMPIRCLESSAKPAFLICKPDDALHCILEQKTSQCRKMS